MCTVSMYHVSCIIFILKVKSFKRCVIKYYVLTFLRSLFFIYNISSSFNNLWATEAIEKRAHAHTRTHTYIMASVCVFASASFTSRGSSTKRVEAPTP